MIEKVKQGFTSMKDELSKKKAEKKQRKLEKEAERMRLEQEKIEAEEKALEEEKARLLQMDQQELMVELIFAVRGFYAKFTELEQSHKDLADSLEEIDIRLTSLEMEVVSLSGQEDTE